MKVALAVNRVLPDQDANLTAILDVSHRAAAGGARLVLFPEAALTGLINDDDPAHDLPLGQPIPGPATARLATLASERNVWLAIGLLEREGDRLYDSAVLIAPDGAIALKYRRVSPGWHGPNADPDVYRQGTGPGTVETPLGTLSFLVCGDLFDDTLVQQVRKAGPDWLLFPFARGYEDGAHDQERWECQDEPAYVERVRLAGVTALMTNYLADETLGDDASFGGAMVVSGSGDVIASFPLGQVGILFAEL